nr:unnamed protein product [Digitaria exilis]
MGIPARRRRRQAGKAAKAMLWWKSGGLGEEGRSWGFIQRPGGGRGRGLGGRVPCVAAMRRAGGGCRVGIAGSAHDPAAPAAWTPRFARFGQVVADRGWLRAEPRSGIDGDHRRIGLRVTRPREGGRPGGLCCHATRYATPGDVMLAMDAPMLRARVPSFVSCLQLLELLSLKAPRIHADYCVRDPNLQLARLFFFSRSSPLLDCSPPVFPSSPQLHSGGPCAALSSPPRAPAQLQLESSWCGSTHDFSVLSLGFGLGTTGRVTGPSPATNIRQGYACLFLSLPILLHEIKHPTPPTSADLPQPASAVAAHLLPSSPAPASSSAGSCLLHRPLLPPPAASDWNGVVSAPYLVGAALERRDVDAYVFPSLGRLRLGDALNSIFLQQLLGVHVYTHVLILGPPLPRR